MGDFERSKSHGKRILLGEKVLLEEFGFRNSSESLLLACEERLLLLLTNNTSLKKVSNDLTLVMSRFWILFVDG